MIAGILFSGEQVVVIVRAQGGGCQGDLQGLMKECMQFVQKIGLVRDPSPSCCDVVKKADFTCVCGPIPPLVQQLISSQKVAYVTHYCGNPIPAGVKCGT
ncbi:uncharacterized protein LOC122665189 [Telopea speciosissima]|uniref:uncharacterized protein LOC122665189 n=1 Tax=Telopea speciosissima TaxID=54955 RepID=UPI001CC3C57A|nr:uncharacterized protein LOC122665189 [Telopea speciosissima]